MIAIILDLIAEKNRVWKKTLPSLSYRYAALKVRGCDPGDRVLRGRIQVGHLPDGLLPSIRVKVCLSRRFISLERR